LTFEFATGELSATRIPACTTLVLASILLAAAHGRPKPPPKLCSLKNAG
jgi:hypothetical protein